MFRLPRLSLFLLAGASAVLALASAGSASHAGPVYLGDENLSNSITSIRATTNGPAFYATNEWGNGVSAIAYPPYGIGVYGIHQATSGSAPGVRGDNYSTEPSNGVEGHAVSSGGSGVYGENTGGGYGVAGRSNQGTTGRGVYGEGSFGVYGSGKFGVYGNSPVADGSGVVGIADSGVSPTGVHGSTISTSANAVGVFGKAPLISAAWAGWFEGDVRVVGTINPAAAANVVDHPRDPANAYLRHPFVGSPEMKNVYDGVVTTNGRGFATVRLPRYFQALNRDFRYQLTPIGRSAWDSRAGVWQEIRDNRFVIRSEPNTKISWQVTGIRKDAYANANRIQVEQAKPAREQGRYLLPELYGKPRTAAIGSRPSEVSKLPPGAK